MSENASGGKRIGTDTVRLDALQVRGHRWLNYCNRFDAFPGPASEDIFYSALIRRVLCGRKHFGADGSYFTAKNGKVLSYVPDIGDGDTEPAEAGEAEFQEPSPSPSLLPPLPAPKPPAFLVVSPISAYNEIIIGDTASATGVCVEDTLDVGSDWWMSIVAVERNDYVTLDSYRWFNVLPAYAEDSVVVGTTRVVKIAEPFGDDVITTNGLGFGYATVVKVNETNWVGVSDGRVVAVNKIDQRSTLALSTASHVYTHTFRLDPIVISDDKTILRLMIAVGDGSITVDSAPDRVVSAWIEEGSDLGLADGAEVTHTGISNLSKNDIITIGSVSFVRNKTLTAPHMESQVRVGSIPSVRFLIHKAIADSALTVSDNKSVIDKIKSNTSSSSVTVSGAGSARVGEFPSHSSSTVTVGSSQTNYLPRTVSIAATSDTYEGVSSGSFRITRIGDTSAVVVNFTVSGTAVRNVDYTIPALSVSFPDGTMVANVVVSGIDDAIYKGTRTIIATITPDPANFNIPVGKGTATMNLYDNDPDTTVTVSTSTATGYETGGSGVFVFTRVGNTTGPLVVNFAVSGTATEGVDFNAIGTLATILAGQSSVSVPVVPIDDPDVEPIETVIVTLVAGGYAIGAPGSATVNIVSEDAMPSIGVTSQVAVASESPVTDGVFRFTRTASVVGVWVNYLLSGTASQIWDYAQLYSGANGTVYIPPGGTGYVDINIIPVNDSTVEPDETVICTIMANAAYVVTAGQQQATVTIQSEDTDNTVSVTANVATAYEGGGDGSFLFTRTGDASSSLTVNYTVSGTATAGDDYVALSGSVVIPGGSALASVPVQVVNDTAIELVAETVIVTVAAGGYAIGSPASATVSIVSDDDIPFVSGLVLTSGSPTNSATVTVDYTATGYGATIEAYAIVQGTAAPTVWNSYKVTSFTIPAPTQGNNTISVFVGDSSGRVSVVKSLNVFYDSVAPVISGYQINGGALWTTSSTVSVSGSGADASPSSGGVEYAISTSSLLPASGWSAFFPSSFTFPAGDGGKTLYVFARDLAGNWSSKVQTVGVDTTAPTLAAFAINGGAVTSPSRTVTITGGLGSDGVGSGVAGYVLKEDSSTPVSGWTGSVPASFVFASDGGKVLYLWCIDAVGNISSPRAQAITVDSVLIENPSFEVALGPEWQMTAGVSIRASSWYSGTTWFYPQNGSYFLMADMSYPDPNTTVKQVFPTKRNQRYTLSIWGLGPSFNEVAIRKSPGGTIYVENYSFGGYSWRQYILTFTTSNDAAGELTEVFLRMYANKGGQLWNCWDNIVITES